MNRSKLPFAASVGGARRLGARMTGGRGIVRAMTPTAAGPLLCLAVLVVLAVPSFGGKREGFDVSDTAWDLDTQASGVVVAPGRGTRRQKLISPALSIAFHPDGTLTLGVDSASYGGTWAQAGKRLDLDFDPLLLETFDSICDEGLGSDCTTSIRVKATASARKGKALLKLKLAYKLSFRVQGQRFRRTDTFRGKGVKDVVQQRSATR